MSAEATYQAPASALDAAAASNLPGRQLRARIMGAVFLLVTSLAVLILGVLLWTVIERGWAWVRPELFENMPSRRPERAGLKPALLGTLWVISLTAVIAFPVGVLAAVYLEEYAPRNWWTKLLRTNIANLAGVPSVVYGLLGLGLFAEWLRLGRSIISGALTMALLILPIIIIASQEAIRAVPPSLRQAAFALGATKWQVARHHVLPVAMPGILTGTILALSRAIGETAPLLVVGAAAYVTFNPDSLSDKFTVLPIQIYEWTRRRQEEFQELASAAIIVLLVVLLLMNAAAIVLRQRFSRKVRW